MTTGHNHAHHFVGARLRTAFLLTLVILAVEIVGGLLSNSLALLSDAGHVLTDLIALGLAWFATVQAERPPDETNTYGYHRTGILVALANATTLILIVAAIAFEAVDRLQHPQAVTPALMFVAATVGIVVNLAIGFGLRSAGEHNLNVRAAMFHVFGDVGASAAVIVGGLVILLTGWYAADAVLSLLIAALIARGAWDILRETVDILMESVPKNLNVGHLVEDLTRLPSVRDVHDLHVWSLAGGMALLSAHVQVTDDCALSSCESVLVRINQMLRDRYAISHTTIQLECAPCQGSGLHCSMTALVPAGHVHEGPKHSHPAAR